LADVASLGQGESVYSVDLWTQTETVALGTRSGKAGMLLPLTAREGGDIHASREYEGKASILSVCLVSATTLAIADAAGGQFLWHAEQGGRVDRLAGGGAIVYALFHPDNRRIAGLSVSGELFTWDLLTRELIDTVRVPKPPGRAALVRPQYWRHEDLWVWPSRSGVLVYYYNTQRTAEAICGHRGDFYAVTACGPELITVGANDRRLKRWRRGCRRPVGECEVSEPVISAVAWGGHRGQILLINESGRAGLYRWSNEKLALVKVLPGEDYRVAFGPDPASFESARQHHQIEVVGQLVEEADAQIAQGQWDQFESVCQRLSDSGYPQVTWALRGRRARIQDDLLGELQAYHELARIIPHDNDGSRESLVHYAGLLESVWQLRDALGLYQRLGALRSNNDGYADKIQRLSDCLGMIESSRGVIEAELPLSSLVKSAAVLGHKATGRYLLLGGGATRCRACLSIDEVAEKYACRSASKPQAPRIEKTELCWLSKGRQEHTPAIVIRSTDGGPFSHLELVIRFFDIQAQTVLMFTIVLNAQRASGNETTPQHNEAILDELARVYNGPMLNSWYHTVFDDIKWVIRQLVTRRWPRSAH
jgi:hypothetical protein